MEALDTNILIRLLMQDAPKQCRQVDSILAAAVDKEEFFLLTDVVLCEMVWVLESAYKVPKKAILTTLEKLLSTRQFRFERAEVVKQAVNDYCHGKADFSDYLLGRVAERAGCTTTHTFDKALRNNSLFTYHQGNKS